MRRRRRALLLALCSVAVFTSPTPSAAQASSETLHHPPGAFLSINGANIWYESEGQGDPIILIAGGPGVSHTYFHPFLSGLADTFRVIYFDAFGTGKSDRASSVEQYTFDREVEEVEALRKALNIERVSIFGHSYGGMVAQAYAVRHSDSVSRLILCDAPHSAEAWQAGNDVVNAEIRNQFPEAWERVLHVRSQGFHSSSKELQDAFGPIPLTLYVYHHPENAEKAVFESNHEVAQQIAGDDADFIVAGDLGHLDLRRSLAKLQMPVMILTGRFDRIFPPRLAAEYKHFLPNAQFVVFEESGHAPFIEETSKFIEVVKTFLRK